MRNLRGDGKPDKESAHAARIPDRKTTSTQTPAFNCFPPAKYAKVEKELIIVISRRLAFPPNSSTFERRFYQFTTWGHIDIGLATVGFQPAGPYLTATPNTRYSFHVCIADRSPSDLFGRKQRLRTLLPPDESPTESDLSTNFSRW